MAEKYGILPYTVRAGEEQALGRWNMMQPSPYVSRVQAVVKMFPDGTAVLESHGKPATGYRQQGGMWSGLQRGQTQILQNGDEISLDSRNPEGAIFAFQAEGGGMQQQGGFGQQQGGYGGQQGGYGQQQGYGY